MSLRHLSTASKYIALILRHDAIKRKIEISTDGYVKVGDLLAEAYLDRVNLTQEMLEMIVATDNKTRYGFHPDDPLLVRAHQGHTMPEIILEYEEKIPPTVLYHGTIAETVAVIMSEGLSRMKRNHVHLSDNTATATIVAQRRGAPVILTVDTKAMVKDGYKFYCSTNNVWLIEHVPAKYITEPWEDE